MFKKITILGLLSASFMLSAQENAVTQGRFSIIPSVGYAWRLAETPDGISNDAKDYIKGLKSGLDVSISGYYHLKNNGAVGVKYSNYSASSEGRLTVQDDFGNSASGYVSTKDNISFIGASYMFSNYMEDTRHKLFYDIALGLITYTSTTGNIEGKGSNLGLDANLGYQYAVTKNILIGPKLGVVIGTLNSMDYNGQNIQFGDGEKEGLSRLSLSVATTFRF